MKKIMNPDYTNALKEVNPMIEWILSNYPDAIKFNPDDSSRRSIAVYLELNKHDTYTSMIMQYGILFLLAALEYHVFIEDYIKCKELHAGIIYCNKIYGTELPTHIDSIWAKENMPLTPSELLKKHFL